MSVRQYLTGFTHSLFFSFWSSGARTSVDQPKVDIFTPHKDRYITGAALTTTELTGKYRYDFYAAPGLTIGHWFSLAVGLSDNSTLYSESNPFEIIDITTEPFWVGLEEFREYLDLEDDDRNEDGKLKQALQAAIELVEGYTNRSYGIYQYDEIIEVVDTDRVKLKKFPINSVVGITPSVKLHPRTVDNLLHETVDDSGMNFYYRLDSDNGIIYLTDSAGFDAKYDDVIIAISYIAGFATVPESVRYAVLSLAAALHNLSCSEGIEAMKFSDVSFSMSKKLFDGHIAELLTPFRNNYQV